MDFSSVDDFIKKASSIKSQDRQLIDDELDPLLSDPATIGVPPGLSTAIERLKEEYGDEAYKQIGMFSLGKWLELHEGVLQQHVETQAVDAALFTMNDITLITLAIQTLERVGSFSGDEKWRKMLKSIVGQSILELIEEDGLDAQSFFARKA
jgi:hypothetical protein